MTKDESLILKLKSGEYDGKDIMKAWISIQELEKELIEERKKHESQIKAMKCCGNCQHYLLNNVTTICVDCDDFNLWQEE